MNPTNSPYEAFLPPQNVELEESILGGILLDPEAIFRAIDLLVPEAFYIGAHQQIYEAMVALHRAGQPADLMTVTTWLRDRGLLERVGGMAKLAQLLDRTVSAVNIDRYAMLVADKALRRQLMAAGHEIVELGCDTTVEFESVLDRAEQKVYRLSHARLHSALERNDAIVAAAFDDLDRDSPIYVTGLDDLDELMVGFEPGTMTILAGRPSMGKSYIASFLALQMMLVHELPVAFFSLEMTKKQLEYRLWSLLSVYNPAWDLIPLEADRLRKHRARLHPLSERELDSIVKIVGFATALPLYVSDDRSLSVSQMASLSRQIQAKTGKKLGLVVVDYLQLMAEDSGGNRSYELGDVARGLYKLAGDLEVPVLALSQISRGVEGRNNKRPLMSDLSQSGILEMVADNVLLAYRDEYYNPDTPDRGVLELIAAKARHGRTGVARVLFDRRFGLLRNLTREQRGGEP